MAHTYVVLFVHCVFSTKGRHRLIPPDVQPRLWAFVGGIARKNRFKAVVIGSTEDHLHTLLSVPATMPVTKAVQLIKGSSSRWMNETGKNQFAWQEGYGAFTIRISQCGDTIRHIQKQSEHHRKRDFQAEGMAFLKKNRVEYDPHFVGDSPRTGFRRPYGRRVRLRIRPGAEAPGYCRSSLRDAISSIVRDSALGTRSAVTPPASPFPPHQSPRHRVPSPSPISTLHLSPRPHNRSSC